MRFSIMVFVVAIIFSCGTPQQKTNTVVIGKDTTSVDDSKPIEEIVVKPVAPKGAITANYLNGVPSFYGYVKHVNRTKGVTTIAFEDEQVSPIIIPDTYGAKLAFNRFPEFDRDLLLVTAKLKDPNFNKYFLYIHRAGQWKLVVNSWAIHKSNNPDSLKPIVVDPSNPNRMKHYYSVFDLDATSELGYTWRLLEESIPMVNR